MSWIIDGPTARDWAMLLGVEIRLVVVALVGVVAVSLVMMMMGAVVVVVVTVAGVSSSVCVGV